MVNVNYIYLEGHKKLDRLGTSQSIVAMGHGVYLAFRGKDAAEEAMRKLQHDNIQNINYTWFSTAGQQYISIDRPRTLVSGLPEQHPPAFSPVNIKGAWVVTCRDVQVYTECASKISAEIKAERLNTGVEFVTDYVWKLLEPDGRIVATMSRQGDSYRYVDYDNTDFVDRSLSHLNYAHVVDHPSFNEKRHVILMLGTQNYLQYDNKLAASDVLRYLRKRLTNYKDFMWHVAGTGSAYELKRLSVTKAFYAQNHPERNEPVVRCSDAEIVVRMANFDRAVTSANDLNTGEESVTAYNWEPASSYSSMKVIAVAHVAADNSNSYSVCGNGLPKTRYLQSLRDKAKQKATEEAAAKRKEEEAEKIKEVVAQTTAVALAVGEMLHAQTQVKVAVGEMLHAQTQAKVDAMREFGTDNEEMFKTYKQSRGWRLPRSAKEAEEDAKRSPEEIARRVIEDFKKSTAAREAAAKEEAAKEAAAKEVAAKATRPPEATIPATLITQLTYLRQDLGLYEVLALCADGSVWLGVFTTALPTISWTQISPPMIESFRVAPPAGVPA